MVHAYFQDLTTDELEKDMYLVAHIYRLGEFLAGVGSQSKIAELSLYRVIRALV